MSNWETCRLKDLGAFYAGATPSSKVEAFWDGDIAWITPADMTEFGDISQGTRSITEAGYNSCGTHKVPAGSIVMSTRAPIGKVNITQGELCTNQGCKTLVPKGCDGRFLLYLLSTQKEVLDSLGQGTTFKELALKNLSSLHVRIPSIDDQNCIVEYLDTKTAAIDSQISVLEKKRDAYERLKQSVINRAVTRGLDANVPLKPSGIDWMGLVPEHWETLRVKDVATLRNERTDETVLPYIALENISSWDAKFHSTSCSTEGTNGICYEGDVLFSKLRPYLAKGYLVQKRSICSTEFFVLIPKKNIRSRYLLYYILSPHVINFIKNQVAGVKMPRTNWNEFGILPIPVPAIEEQTEIERFLDYKSAEIDRAIVNTNKQIDAYKRLKRSLINEVVTGQRAV